MQLRGLFLLYITCTLLSTLAGCLECEKEKTTAEISSFKGRETMETLDNTTVNSGIPAIDARAPLITKKAYFALG